VAIPIPILATVRAPAAIGSRPASGAAMEPRLSANPKALLPNCQVIDVLEA